MSIPFYRITISERIKKYRRENDLSQKAFGKLVGVSAQAVYKWEQDLCYPDIFTLPRLASFLGCSTDDFFSKDEGTVDVISIK